MPTRVELDYFIAHAASIPRPDQDATLTRLHRVTRAAHAARRGVRLRVRPSQAVLRRWRRKPAPPKRACARLKQLFVDAVARGRAQLPDAARARSASCATTATGRTRSTPRPAAAGGSAGRSSCRARNPLEFERGRSIGTTLDRAGRTSTSSSAWSRYHPDDAGRAPPRAGSADARALRRRAGERPRAPARDHSADARCRATTTRCCAR